MVTAAALCVCVCSQAASDWHVQHDSFSSNIGGRRVIRVLTYLGSGLHARIIILLLNCKQHPAGFLLTQLPRAHQIKWKAGADDPPHIFFYAPYTAEDLRHNYSARHQSIPSPKWNSCKNHQVLLVLRWILGFKFHSVTTSTLSLLGGKKEPNAIPDKFIWSYLPIWSYRFISLR